MRNLPNIIFILADDMGYGDMAANNPESKIPTPSLDRLCREGMRFTDAHAGTSVCTPSRYNILTGRYCWRSDLKNGIVWEWDHSLVEEERTTVAHLLKKQGYGTYCLGKWHLGWDWATKDGTRPNETLVFGDFDAGGRQAYEKNIDYGKPVKGGPVDRGFDTYFGIDVPNFPPYTWYEDDRLLIPPTEEKPDSLFGRPGAMAPGWDLKKMIPEFTRRAVELIKDQKETEEPFFLYYAITSPHTPVCPNDEFLGKSGAGLYGDFVMETDWSVGEILRALDESGQAENTLVIFTSDNGSEGETSEEMGIYNRIREYGHNSSAEFRGMKRDAWEGGHRVPYAVRWPKVIKAGSICDKLVSLGDFWDTCRDISGAATVPGEGVDSISLLPLLKGEEENPARDHIVHHSMSGKFALRRGNWVFIDASCGGDNKVPEWYNEQFGYGDNPFSGELYDLSRDEGERKNLYGEEPERVKEMAGFLEQYKKSAGAKAMKPMDPKHDLA